MNLKKALRENKSIRFNIDVQTWQEAIFEAVKPLVESGAVTEKYYDAIIASTEEYGPYYVLMPGMAMPHARPDESVIRDAFSLITLKNPVSFSDGSSVSVLITLAATSSQIHTSVAIPQIIALLELDNSIERILACQDAESIFEMINESQNSPYLEGFNLDE